MNLLLPWMALAPAVVQLAQAGEVERAEHSRISEEMRKAAQRNNWAAVEQRYQELKVLEAKGEQLTAKEHHLGAQAARALGDLKAARDRLQKSLAQEESREVVDFLAEIDAVFGGVKINVDNKYTGDRALTPTNPPFEPDSRAAIAYANQALAKGSFDGLLPSGEYTFAGKTFQVSAGQSTAPLSVGPSPKQPFKPAYVGPRVAVGAAFTSIGASEAGDGRPEVTGSAGIGARTGLGLELGLSPSVGVLAEVGYQGMFGGAIAEGTNLPFEPGNSSLQAGYGWLAGSYRASDLWLQAGPTFSGGKARVAGSAAASCPDSLQTLESAACGDTAVVGTLKMAGLRASVSYGLFNVGPLRTAITLSGGAQNTSAQWVTTGDVGLTLAPAGKGTP